MPGTFVTCSPLCAASQLESWMSWMRSGAGSPSPVPPPPPPTLVAPASAPRRSRRRCCRCRPRPCAAPSRCWTRRPRARLADDRRAVADEVDRGGLAGRGVAAGQRRGAVDESDRAGRARHRIVPATCGAGGAACRRCPPPRRRGRWRRRDRAAERRDLPGAGRAARVVSLSRAGPVSACERSQRPARCASTHGSAAPPGRRRARGPPAPGRGAPRGLPASAARGAPICSGPPSQPARTYRRCRASTSADRAPCHQRCPRRDTQRSPSSASWTTS